MVKKGEAKVTPLVLFLYVLVVFAALLLTAK